MVRPARPELLIASFHTGDAEITAADATDPASDGISDDAQLWVRGNSGSAIGAVLRGSDDPDSGTDKAALAWYHQNLDHVLAKIVAHAADNHWSLYTTPYPASNEPGTDNNQFRKRLDISGGDERTKVNWRNLSEVEYRPTEHADAGAGNFNIRLRQPTTDDRTQHIYAGPGGGSKFGIGYNEFDQFFIEEIGGVGTFFRMNEGDDRPTFDSGASMYGELDMGGQYPIKNIRILSNAGPSDLSDGEFVLDTNRGGSGNTAWLAKDKSGNVHYWDADGTL